MTATQTSTFFQNEAASVSAWFSADTPVVLAWWNDDTETPMRRGDLVYWNEQYATIRRVGWDALFGQVFVVIALRDGGKVAVSPNELELLQSAWW